MESNMNNSLEMQAVAVHELELVAGGGPGAWFRDIGQWIGEGLAAYGEACAESGCTPMS